MPVVDDPQVFAQAKTTLPQQKEASKIWSSASTAMILPSVYFPEDELSRNTNILSEVRTYVSEMFNKFIMGIEPLSSFDEYQQRISDMGMDEVLESYQRAYDRYLEKYGN